MSFTELALWLEKIKKQHRAEIDLTLERVRSVAKNLDLTTPHCPIIIVGGTNGKGSTVAGLEAIYLAAGYTVGAFTSPYLYSFNEIVRINGQSVQDEEFIRVFEQIDQARGEITLTQFEFNTLAALLLFRNHYIAVGILEVGLGGRLDAVNILDADATIITSIDIDHADLLGNTREKIALEKVGICRSGKPLVCGEYDPPISLLQYVSTNFIPMYKQGDHFYFEETKEDWSWHGQGVHYSNLPLPQLALCNISSVLMLVELMQEKLPVSKQNIITALTHLNLPGRIQILPGNITTILDVSHNPAAAVLLANYLQTHPVQGKVRAVFSMLADKDIIGTLHILRELIAEWHIAALPVERGSPLSVLEYCFRSEQIENVISHSNVKEAYESAKALSQLGDTILVFGSFYTVAEIGGA